MGKNVIAFMFVLFVLADISLVALSWRIIVTLRAERQRDRPKKDHYVDIEDAIRQARQSHAAATELLTLLEETQALRTVQSPPRFM
jgi:hypothetical protein